MQKSISKVAFTWRLILSVLVVSSLISCENSNTVGGGVVDSAGIRIDTVSIPDFQQNGSDIFSGKLQSLPIGEYNDPLYGSSRSIAYFKPSLGPARDASLSLLSDFILKLQINNNLHYGDTSQVANYSVYKVTERWRGNTISSTDNISFDTSELLGSFSYQNEDSVSITLSQSLLEEYAEYVNNDSSNVDSLYNFEFFGIAIVPDNVSAQIIYPNIIGSEFLTIRRSTQDSVSINLQDYAFTLDRQNTPMFPNRLYLNNYLESFYSINFETVANNLSNENILRAELVLYEDADQISTSLPQNHIRPETRFLDLKFASESELRYDLQFTTTDFVGVLDTTDNTFRFNVTNHINNYIFGSPDERELYLNINPNGGIFNSTILFDNTSTAAMRPKLILTIEE
ncbi:MAG: hypothetical protein ABJR05_09540 [Balneola sp.]